MQFSNEDEEGHQPRWLNELFIHPLGEDKNFTPKHDNWRRAAKVPILILNATTLNTGHNWQFTASWMGEPPSSINTDVDGSNYRLRRMYYHEAPSPHRRIKLGYAVAASACVPGLFEPIVLTKLYQRHDKDINVRLVDGGVHDNQGSMGLLDQDCNAIIISDASGQIGTQDDPIRGIIGVPLRSNSILMARVREAEYRELNARLRSSQLRNLMFIHLKKDLDVNPVDWMDCQDPVEASDEARPVHKCGTLTSYGILKEIQEKLAAIRTDLDSFGDAEAYALMTSGYRMVESEFDRQFATFPASMSSDAPDWDFFSVNEAMQDYSKSRWLLKLLNVSSQRAFKIWKLSLPLKISSWMLGAIALVLLLWICWKWSSVVLITLGRVGTAVAVLIAGAIFGKTVVRIVRFRVRFRDTLNKIAIGVASSLWGWIAARIHLHVFDKWYLRAGKVRFTRTLNKRQYDQAETILNRERQSITLSSWQDSIFKIFNFTIYGLGIVGCIFLLILILGESYMLIDKSFDRVHLWSYIITLTNILLIIIGIPVAILSVWIVIIFLFKFPNIRQLLRQNRKIRELRLQDTIRAPWFAKKRKNRRHDVLSLCIRIIGMLFMLYMAAFLIILCIIELHSLIYLVLILMSIFACGSAIAANHIVQGNKERLKLISQIYSSMKEDKSDVEELEGDGVQISAEVYEKIAQIERAQFSRERVLSILAESDEEDFIPYVLQKSRAAQDAHDRLDPATRMLVQEKIDALMTEPHPPGAVEDTQVGTLKLRVAQTPVTVRYSVEYDTHRIRILSLDIILEEYTSLLKDGE